MHWIDPVISFFRLSVCVSVNKSVLERLRPQFFTDFHEILHAAQKCGRFVGRRLLFVKQTGSSLPFLEMCGFRFRQSSGSGDHIFQ